jgi:hypothetical protein
MKTYKGGDIIRIEPYDMLAKVATKRSSRIRK